MSLILSGTDGLSDVDGSAATPAIRGTDTNTGIFFPAADTVGVATGGSERLRVDSSGNVGIGTSSPNKSASNIALTVNAALGQYPALELSTNNVGRWYINADATNVYDTAMNNTNRTFYTGGSERMRIDSSGNVGIGTTSPAFKLEVVGGTNNGIHIKDAASATVFGGLFTQASAFALIARSNHALTLGTNDTERMRIDSSGNVGIGVTPVANFGLLQVNTATNGTAAYLGNGAGVHAFNSAGYYSSAVTLSSAGTWTARSTGSGIISPTNSGTILFYTDTGLTSGNTFSPTERMRIDSSGNLLVGTSTKYGKVTSESATFDPGASGNIVNAAFTARGNYGGGVSILDGTQGYTMWAQNSGADLYIRRATTSSAYTGGVYISNAAGSWSAASDERLKNIIRPIENAVENLSGLRCVIGEYKDNIGAHHPFLIAQDVQAVFPEVVNQMDEQGHLGMSYTDIVPILVKAIQEQQDLILSLTARITALETK